MASSTQAEVLHNQLKQAQAEGELGLQVEAFPMIIPLNY